LPDPFDPGSSADLLAVFIFSDAPGSAKSENHQIPVSLSPPPPIPPVTISNAPPSPPPKPVTSMPIARYLMLGIGLLVFIALAVAVVRLAMPRRKS
jgi:hypothetical protein